MTKPDTASIDRAAYYQSEKVDRLREEITAARQRVQQGFGAEVLPVFHITVADWLEMLEADLLEAECDLETLNAERGAMQ